MEEDIKILEDMIKRLDKNCFDIYRKASNTEDYLGTIIGYEIISLENLIKGYRELEERNIYLVNERKKLEELLFMSNENYIEKSKIREKIEELEEEIDKAIDNSKGGLDEDFIKKGTELLAKKQALQELMEEK